MAHKAIVEKFPIVIQHDAMQCGIACMQMACKFYGREYSQEYRLSYAMPRSREFHSLPSMKPWGHWAFIPFVHVLRWKRWKKFLCHASSIGTKTTSWYCTR